MQIPVPEKLTVYGHRIKQEAVVLPVQLGLPWFGRHVYVDGHIDEKGIRYIGHAKHVFDNMYWCLADVGGALCAVEVTIRPHDHLPPSPTT